MLASPVLTLVFVRYLVEMSNEKLNVELRSVWKYLGILSAKVLIIAVEVGRSHLTGYGVTGELGVLIEQQGKNF